MDPLLPHLLDILSDPCSNGLILGGGFGILLKREHIAASGIRTLIHEVPVARPTQDLDFFLRLEIFARPGGANEVRSLLDRLHYVEQIPRWQYVKSRDTSKPPPDFKIKVDLLARLPEADERSTVKVKSPRVGSGSSIHGRETPEAFAVEEGACQISVRGSCSNGSVLMATIQVPHPYSWINMKVQAAYDWLRMERGELKRKSDAEKHVFDVYILVAMLTEDEINTSVALAAHYADYPLAQIIKAHALELFSDIQASGTRAAIRQAPAGIDYSTFWEALQQVLGLAL